MVITARCAANDRNNNHDDGSYSKEFKDFPTAAREGTQTRKWKNVNAMQWHIALISFMLMAIVAWCIFYTQAKYREGGNLVALFSGKLSHKTIPEQ